MKNIIFTILAISLVAISCTVSKPLSKMPSDNNETYKVEYLFEHDGCKVYRFMDYGNYVYFTNCEGNTTAIGTDSIAHRTFNTIRIK